MRSGRSGDVENRCLPVCSDGNGGGGRGRSCIVGGGGIVVKYGDVVMRVAEKMLLVCV